MQIYFELCNLFAAETNAETQSAAEPDTQYTKPMIKFTTDLFELLPKQKKKRNGKKPHGRHRWCVSYREKERKRCEVKFIDFPIISSREQKNIMQYAIMF